MRSAQLEAWVLSVVDQVEQHLPVEDSRIELKAQWPEPVKAARRMAGHVNAARGERILWIIGLDQENGVVQLKPSELANWLPQVFSHFESLVPSVIDLIIPVRDKVIVALLIDTTRAPYVVKNPIASGPVTHEVPWREGTRIRSAGRSDLLRLLIPAVVSPNAELVYAGANAAEAEYGRNDLRLKWKVEFCLYLEPRTEHRIVFPRHKARLWLSVPDDIPRTIIRDVRLTPPTVPQSERSQISYRDEDQHLPGSHTIRASLYEAIVDGPGQLRIVGEVWTPLIQPLPKKLATLSVRLRPAGSDLPIECEAVARPIPILFREAKGWWSTFRAQDEDEDE